MTARHAAVHCTLGTVTLVARGSALAGLYFPDHRHPPRADALGERVDAENDPVLGRAARELDEYLRGERHDFEVAVNAEGDDFSRRVWSMLQEIPYGETTTYGALAAELRNRHLAQRVGQAVGRNPLCVFIPCHRVVGSDGSLTGYAGGLERKRTLLTLEEPVAASAARLF